jgi:hypothetical protein
MVDSREAHATLQAQPSAQEHKHESRLSRRDDKWARRPQRPNTFSSTLMLYCQRVHVQPSSNAAVFLNRICQDAHTSPAAAAQPGGSDRTCTAPYSVPSVPRYRLPRPTTVTPSVLSVALTVIMAGRP